MQQLSIFSASGSPSLPPSSDDTGRTASSTGTLPTLLPTPNAMDGMRGYRNGPARGRGGDMNDSLRSLSSPGGFPCQPFSHAGRRKGTADDRYQWPNMFAVIRNTKPEWVIAENVRGLVTWNDGLVLETVCTDLESEGYEVQPFVIPAVAVGAPHRRDRVWIIGHRPDSDRQRIGDGLGEVQGTDGEIPERHHHAKPGDTGGRTDKHPEHPGQHGTEDTESPVTGGDSHPARTDEPLQPTGPGRLRTEDADARSYPDWSRSWQEVAFATCDDSVDDGLSRLVDGVPMSRPKWRQNSLKAYGNGIVPEVAMNIMQAIKESIHAI
jgi:DNA (cytosine-5)-methyltransferase 1